MGPIRGNGGQLILRRCLGRCFPGRLKFHLHQRRCLQCPSCLQVSLSDLPPGVSLVTAEAVLFVGKAQRMLLGWPRGGRGGPRAPPAPSAAVQRFAGTLRELRRQPALDQIRLEQAVNAVHGEVRNAAPLQHQRQVHCEGVESSHSQGPGQAELKVMELLPAPTDEQCS